MISWRAPAKRPIIAAHRGSSRLAPENTLAAFRRAVLDGADAIEFDVRLSRDGVPVVIHDAALGRTTTGRGFVRKHTLAELRRESAGAWFDERFTPERIPTLEEVLQEFSGRIALNIELKASRRERSSLLVERVCSLTAHFRPEGILLTSFNHRLILEVRKRNSRLATGFLLHGWQTLRRRVSSSRADVDYVVCAGTALRKAFVVNAHGKGKLVGEYTVNSKPRVMRALHYGIDVLITDEPATVRSVLCQPGRS